jgi:hypothetical protein
MRSSLGKPVGVGIVAGVLTAVAVFGGTGAFLAAAQDGTDTTVQSPDSTVPETTAPDTTESPDTTPAPDTTESPDPTPAPDESAPSDEDRQAQREEWRQCMADHGVDLPVPQLDENGRPVRPRERPQLDDAQREAFKAAAEACGFPPGLRHGGPGGGGREGCEKREDVPGETTPDETTPDETAPSVEGSSYSV